LLAVETPAAATAWGRFARRLQALKSWPAFLAALAAGAVSTLALPPVHALPVLLLAFPTLLWLLDASASPRRAFLVGWAFGFGFFLFGLYWIAFALSVDWARFWWMTPFVAAGLPAFLAIFVGLVALAYRALRLSGHARLFAFAILWALAEWLRGWVLTGFPWNLIGYGWTGFLPVLQSVSLIGIYGLSFLTVLAAVAPAALASAAFSSTAFSSTRAGRNSALAVALLPLAALAALGAWGALRLATDTQAASGPTLRIVQPNIDQRDKMASGNAVANFQRLLELGAAPAREGSQPRVMILPETAVPFLLEEDDAAAQLLGALVPPGGYVITGAIRRAGDGTAAQPWRYWNSLQALDHTGAVRASFDKFHLVPFGEYMPLRDILPVDAIAAGAVDFSAGDGPKSLRLPELPAFSATICYEAIFPGAVTDAADRPAWIVNVTNDGWYGETAGPHQHFAMARTRAVEEGLPLVRAANTGISAVIDPYGRIVARLPLGETGFLDASLPTPVAEETFYQRHGELVFFGMISMITAVLMIVILRRKF
jgi:apolipoprotein N-acyltransferase